MAAEKKKRKKWLIAVIALVVVAGLAAGAWFFFLKPPDAQAMRQRTFTAAAEKGDQTLTVSVSGALSPKNRADLNFSVSGEVNKVYVKVGDVVKKGDKLARVGSSDLENAVELAEANLKAAKADYTEAKSSGTSASKTAASARVDSAQASLDKAEENLENATLKATIAGTVAEVNVEVGDQVGSSGSGGGSSSMGSTSTSTAQVVVIATSEWKLEGTITAADLASVSAGQTAQVTTDSSDEPMAGTVASVGIVATSSSDGTATFPVVVELDGEHPELFSGTNADAVITVAEYKDVLTVPTAAVTTVNGTSQVTLAGDAGEVREVTVGRVFGNATEITSGLEEGEEVVVTQIFGESSGEGGPVMMGGGMFGGGGVVVERGGGSRGGGGAPGGGNGPQFSEPNR
ncbi:MAG: efflux RND transporter periplasmic adaptor subunit [Propionibacteriaceae bacterium]|jgi:macrolide-specific efflux system membrane fusion protein|nr:efflux RND transporter periplasmic adaptor subunit [Propionibacteriaceae bacterium]